MAVSPYYPPIKTLTRMETKSGRDGHQDVTMHFDNGEVVNFNTSPGFLPVVKEHKEDLAKRSTTLHPDGMAETVFTFEDGSTFRQKEPWKLVDGQPHGVMTTYNKEDYKKWLREIAGAVGLLPGTYSWDGIVQQVQNRVDIEKKWAKEIMALLPGIYNWEGVANGVRAMKKDLDDVRKERDDVRKKHDIRREDYEQRGAWLTQIGHILGGTGVGDGLSFHFRDLAPRAKEVMAEWFTMRTEREKATSEAAAARVERNAMIKERDEARKERNYAMQQRDAVFTERDKAQREYKELEANAIKQWWTTVFTSLPEPRTVAEIDADICAACLEFKERFHWEEFQRKMKYLLEEREKAQQVQGTASK